MKSKCANLLAAIVLSSTALMFSQVATDVEKGTKTAGHHTKVAAQKTTAGTEKAADKTGDATEKAAKKTGHGIKKGVKAVGHGVKKGAEKTADVAK